MKSIIESIVLGVLGLSLILGASFGCGKKVTRESASDDPGIDYSQPNTIEPNLPNVLLIGDSIRDGYLRQTRARLNGIANVFGINDNCRHTRYGVQHVDEWVAGRTWKVIHFNFGMWDFAHKQYDHPELNGPKGPPSDSNGYITTSPWQYRDNLKQIVARLKTTGANLIFATTTPVPIGGTGSRFEGSDVMYNDFAKAVMVSEGVAIDDLHAQILPVDAQYHQPYGDVHFTDAGNDVLSGFVATAIQGAL